VGSAESAADGLASGARLGAGVVSEVQPTATSATDARAANSGRMNRWLVLEVIPVILVHAPGALGLVSSCPLV
jgi:hypothetical protein